MTMSMVFIGCQNEEGVTNPQSNDFQSSNHLDPNLFKRIDVNIDAGVTSMASRNAGNKDDAVLNMMTQINASLAGQGILLQEVEMQGYEEVGRTVIFSNKGNKQLGSDFVPNDPRNIGGANIPYWVDNTELGTVSGMSPQATFDAIQDTMNIWDAITCSDGLNIPFLGVSGIDLGLVQYLQGFGGYNGAILGTIGHAGILPAAFFESLTPGGGNGILGVTFTFIYGNSNGPTDIDGNGKLDVAFREIYINNNPAFNYQDTPDDVIGNGIIDFETVVLHEVGHGLSQAHFGTAFFDPAGGLHFSPDALMNAGYSVGRRVVEESDSAGHCSLWDTWPYE